ncbi:hypothetical protein VTL71DRAFT_15899 [Oculimacula yallundae]|uniref:RING-type domain-containing protein n=1 Tax=Oculimacula yallundae TaxID=86028 RepID=A0ABR4CCZ8_9HELO
MAISELEDCSPTPSSHLNTLPLLLSSSSSLTLSPICAICHSSYNTPHPDGTIETPSLLPCSHIFGSLCIARWLESSQHQDCPNCRREMRYSGCGHVVIPKPVLASMLLLKEDGDQSELSGAVVQKEDMPALCLLCREGKEMEEVVKRAERRLKSEERALEGLGVLDGVFGGLYKGSGSGMAGCREERGVEARERWKDEMRILREGLRVKMEGREDW